MTRGPVVTDTFGRRLRDLRVSVTDRCNFRCRYCMPREVFGPDHAFLQRDELLSFEEIHRLVRVAAGLGVRSVRLTGGEPLLRRGLPDLIGMLTSVPGIEDLALTTNGVLLPRLAGDLRAAGLNRVTVSLDALDDAAHRAIVDTDVRVDAVLAGVDAAVEAGLEPLKVNAVLKRGVNEDQIEPLAGWARERGVTVRFIEFMDVGATNQWRLDDVVPAAEVIQRISARWPLEQVDPAVPSEVARRWRYLDGAGEVGVIASVTQPFCQDCTRARLTSIGELYTCLFATRGTDLRALVRSDASDTDLAEAMAGRWEVRDDRYSEERGSLPLAARVAADGGEGPAEMSYLGG